MNILLRELRSNKKSLIIWCISIFLFISMGMVKYSGFSKMGDEAMELINSLPGPMIKMFKLNVVNLTEIGGYYTIFYIYFLLLAGAHAITLGASIISKEERDKTADFLLVKPIKRHSIVTQKLLFSIISLIIVNVTVLLSSLLYVFIYNKGESITPFVVKSCLLLLLVQGIFLSIGLLISSITKNTKQALSASTGILMATYILSLAIPLSEKLSPLRFITPFSYFDIKLVLLKKSLESVYFFISALLIVIFISLTYLLFNKKDIHS